MGEKSEFQIPADKLKEIESCVKAPAEFTSPDVLYDELIASVKKYHPSTDISIIEKDYKTAREARKDQAGENRVSRILLTLFVLQSYWRIWS